MCLVNMHLTPYLPPLWFLIPHEMQSKFQTKLASTLTSPQSYGSALHIFVFDMRRRYWWKHASFHSGNLIVVHITMQCTGGGFKYVCFFSPSNWGKMNPFWGSQLFQMGWWKTTSIELMHCIRPRSLWSSQTWAPMPMLCERHEIFFSTPGPIEG